VSEESRIGEAGADAGGAPRPGGGAEGAIPWRAFLREATSRLREAGSPDPGGDARRIVERASGWEGGDHHLHLDDPATVRQVAFLDAMVERRAAGEPLQYVVGRWGFRTLDLLVDRRVLIPRPETETVVDWALAEVDRRRAERPGPGAAPVTVVDLGTGSGAIALAVAVERPGVDVWATDRSPDALAVARANLAGIGSAAARVRLAAGDWFAALPGELRGATDLIVSNPPYVAAADDLPAEVRDWEPVGALIAGPTGREDLERLVDEAPDWLAPGGALVVELAPHQAALVAERARAGGYAEVFVRADLTGRERLVVARR
jgi:release factor glutamine methyltransferase